MTETEAKWAARVEQWRQSGKTAREFAEGRDFRWTTLRQWGSELRRKAKVAMSESKGPGQVRMAQVVRVSPPGLPTVMISVGSAQVIVRAGFDPSLLRAVVQALGQGT